MADTDSQLNNVFGFSFLLIISILIQLNGCSWGGFIVQNITHLSNATDGSYDIITQNR